MIFHVTSTKTPYLPDPSPRREVRIPGAPITPGSPLAQVSYDLAYR